MAVENRSDIDGAVPPANALGEPFQVELRHERELHHGAAYREITWSNPGQIVAVFAPERPFPLQTSWQSETRKARVLQGFWWEGAYGIRTRAAAVRGRCPRPLDECAEPPDCSHSACRRAACGVTEAALAEMQENRFFQVAISRKRRRSRSKTYRDENAPSRFQFSEERHTRDRT